MLRANGTRQPQLLKLSPAIELNSLTMPVDSSSPMGTPTCGQLAQNPRRRWVPHSMDSRTEPPHSPPTPIPWNIRRTISTIGAAMPISP